MSREIVIGYKGLEIRHKEASDKEICDLLGKTIQGTEGGLRYSVRDLTQRMNLYGSGLSFVALYKKNILAGAIGLCKRKTNCLGKEYNSTFLRYLSVRSSFQISRVKNRRAEKLAQAEDSFKQQIFSMFSDAAGLNSEKENTSEPHLVYACVESENMRSRNFVRQAGYEQIRSMSTLAFSRFKPSRNSDMMKIAREEEPMMARLLEEQYSNYCFYTGEFSFINNRYYVLRKNKEIVAGVNALPTIFKVIDFPGFQGWMLMHVMPYLPWFRKLFRPGEFRFLVFDSIYCRAGYEDSLPDLFQAVCAEENHNSAITWLDGESDLYKSLKENRKMGVLNTLLKTGPVLVYASFSNMNPDEKKKFFDFPAYISGIDFV